MLSFLQCDYVLYKKHRIPGLQKDCDKKCNFLLTFFMFCFLNNLFTACFAIKKCTLSGKGDEKNNDETNF